MSLVLWEIFFFFFFNDTATTEIYTLSLHGRSSDLHSRLGCPGDRRPRSGVLLSGRRSEEHTSELQSRSDLVCRLLLEKKKKKKCTIQACYIKKSDWLGNLDRQK